MYVSINPNSKLHNELIKKCQENSWLKVEEDCFEEDPFLKHDSPFSFAEVETIDDLQEVFESGAWAIRTGFIYKDLAFINQVNGGDEWWTLKYDRDNGEWISFESISFRIIIQNSDFEAYIKRLENATIEQCRSLKY